MGAMRPSDAVLSVYIGAVPCRRTSSSRALAASLLRQPKGSVSDVKRATAHLLDGPSIGLRRLLLRSDLFDV
jgi:hypothetical protein